MKKITLYFFIIFSLNNYAQRLANVEAFVAGSGVGLKFNITKGASCSGYVIWHSSDSISFTQAYNYPGICGDTSRNESINYLHTIPKYNAVNYYKVELVPIESSSIKRVFVPELLTADIRVYPDPILSSSESLNVRIYRADNTHITGFVSDQNGKRITIIDQISNADLITINAEVLNNGIYLLWINDGQRSFTSKFFIHL
ncbi:MAG: T9SS type A sorting domain-containing protein [Bacteroidia bacterium]